MLQNVHALLRDMRIGLTYPNSVWDEESAVKRYLLYLSILVDAVLADTAISAINGNDIMVSIKLRMMIEYAVKGAYFNEHTDYALYMMTIGEATEAYKKLSDGSSEQQDISDAHAHLLDMKRRFPLVSKMNSLQFDKLMANYAARGDYVWIYKAPSTILHGDPLGMRKFSEALGSNTNQMGLNFALPEVHAMLVDLAFNAQIFCSHFIDRFRPDNVSISERANELRWGLLALILRYPYGRDNDGLEAVRKELAER